MASRAYLTIYLDDTEPHFKYKGNIIELLGMQEYLRQKIQALVDDSEMTGSRLTHEVGKAVALVNDKVDKVTKIWADYTSTLKTILQK